MDGGVRDSDRLLGCGSIRVGGGNNDGWREL